MVSKLCLRILCFTAEAEHVSVHLWQKLMKYATWNINLWGFFGSGGCLFLTKTVETVYS